MAFSSLGCHNLQFIGKRAKAADAPILVLAPHCGFFDSYPHFWLGSPSYVGEKQFIDNTPFLGCRYWLFDHQPVAMMKMSEPIAVDRNDKKSRARTVELIRDRAEKLVSEPHLNWPQLVLFPEGTCTNLKSLVGFKIGKKYGMNKRPPFDVPFAFITMLPVHIPTEEEKNDPDLYAENVRKEMAKCLDISLSPFVYEDSKSISHSCQKNPEEPQKFVLFKHQPEISMMHVSKTTVVLPYLLLPRPAIRGINVMRETWLNLCRSRFSETSFQVTLQQFAEYTKVSEVDWMFKRLFNCLNWVSTLFLG
uniref:Phospholipid/glycerol acyltransferase domain-containing protein n=1 Tax=Romanomermis culicivorax TaxID=13658 RepID=A0A915L225_ROMCU